MFGGVGDEDLNQDSGISYIMPWSRCRRPFIHDVGPAFSNNRLQGLAAGKTTAIYALAHDNDEHFDMYMMCTTAQVPGGPGKRQRPRTKVEWGRSSLQAGSGMPRRASASHIFFDLAGPDVFGQRLAECATAVVDVVEAHLPRPRCLLSIISSSCFPFSSHSVAH